MPSIRTAGGHYAVGPMQHHYTHTHATYDDIGGRTSINSSAVVPTELIANTVPRIRKTLLTSHCRYCHKEIDAICSKRNAEDPYLRELLCSAHEANCAAQKYSQSKSSHNAHSIEMYEGRIHKPE